MIDPSLKFLIERVYPFTDEEILALQNSFTSKKIEKNGFILKEGQHTEALFFIKSKYLQRLLY